MQEQIVDGGYSLERQLWHGSMGASAYHRDCSDAPHNGGHHNPAESLTVGSES